MEQSRALLESQRLNFERERMIFENERKLWHAERAMLRSRISELEGKSRSMKPARRRFSNETSASSFNSLSLRRSSQDQTTKRSTQMTSESASDPPVWDKPHTPVTRVFPNEEHPSQGKKVAGNISSFPSGTKTANGRPLSPRSAPVSVTMLDSSLDGITLKPGGLESSFVKVSSPRTSSPSQASSPQPQIQLDGRTLKVNLDRLTSASSENLVKNAGHTPMEYGKPISSTDTPATSQSRSSPVIGPEPTRDDSKTLLSSRINVSAPVKPPSERADSYFSSALAGSKVGKEASVSKLLDAPGDEPVNRVDIGDAGGDVELKGPLIMNSKPAVHGQPDRFLDELNARLRDEVERQPSSDSQKNRETSVSNGHDEEPVYPDALKADTASNDVDDGGPRLKLKKSMNFGSAFGSNKVGRI